MADNLLKSHEVLFAIDIDGTLLDANHQITARTLRAVQALREYAHISLVSARPLSSVLKIARMLGLEGPMAALNGAIISDHKENIYVRRSLPAADIKIVIRRFINHPEMSLNFYNGTKWVVSRSDKRIDEEARILGFSYDELIPPDDLEKWVSRNPVEKILLLHEESARSEIDSWCAEIKDSMCLAYSKAGYFEITSAGNDKASALKVLAGHYGLPLEKTVAIGDGDVDMPMLKACGWAVVMQNASDEIRALGKQVIGNHNEEGLAIFLENCLLEHEDDRCFKLRRRAS